MYETNHLSKHAVGYIEVAELRKEYVVIYDVKSLSEVYKQRANIYAVMRLAHEWWTCLDGSRTGFRPEVDQVMG